MSTGASTRVSKIQKKLLVRLREVLRHSELPEVALPPITFQEFFATKGIDYSGEEVRVAKIIPMEDGGRGFP